MILSFCKSLCVALSTLSNNLPFVMLFLILSLSFCVLSIISLIVYMRYKK